VTRSRCIELAVIVLLLLLWLDWRMVRNLAMGLLAFLHLPIYLIESGNWRIFLPVLALAALMMAVAVGIDLWKWITHRGTRSS
jgi:hypothetical protein